MNEFAFSIPQDILVGRGTAERLGEAAKKIGGTHAFIISGPHLTKMGHVKHCADLLAAAGIPSDIFSGTEGNPSVETVAKAAAAFKESGADFIVASGGGSPMDVAKAVAVVAKYGGSITDYEGGGKVPGDIIPLIAIPTTAGTGSEVTAFSVITDHARNYKLTVFSYKLIPKYAILDADFLTTAPARVAAACGASTRWSTPSRLTSLARLRRFPMRWRRRRSSLSAATSAATSPTARMSRRPRQC